MSILTEKEWAKRKIDLVAKMLPVVNYKGDKGEKLKIFIS